MTDPEIRRPAPHIALIALAAAAAAATAFAQSADARLHGRRLAGAHCGQCHALGAGPSPLADAPPFATLHRRYPEGGSLRDLLGEGMIAPATPPEEGQPGMHPRMPQAHLDDDEVADLIAFLRAVQGADDRRPRRLVLDPDQGGVRGLGNVAPGGAAHDHTDRSPIFDGRAAQRG